MDPRFGGSPALTPQPRRPKFAAATTASTLDPPLQAPPGPPRVLPSLFAPFVALALALLAVPPVFSWYKAHGGGIGSYGAESVRVWLEQHPGIIGLLLLWQQLVMAGVAVVAAALSPVPWRQRLRLVRAKAPARGYGFALLGAFGIDILVLGTASALTLLGWMSLPEDMGLSSVLLEDPRTRALIVPLLGLVPGVCEELMFRGYMQTRLVERWGPALGIGVTSVLVAVGHVHTGAFVMAGTLWFGYVAWRTGSIFPAMFCHAITNAAWFSFSFFPELGEQADWEPWSTIGAFVLGAVATGIGIRGFRRATSAPDTNTSGATHAMRDAREDDLAASS